MPNVKLHLYCKEEAKANRKMGHMVALAESSSAAAKQVLAARESLTIKASSAVS